MSKLTLSRGIFCRENEGRTSFIPNRVERCSASTVSTEESSFVIYPDYNFKTLEFVGPLAPLTEENSFRIRVGF